MAVIRKSSKHHNKSSVSSMCQALQTQYEQYERIREEKKIGAKNMQHKKESWISQMGKFYFIMFSVSPQLTSQKQQPTHGGWRFPSPDALPCCSLTVLMTSPIRVTGQSSIGGLNFVYFCQVVQLERRIKLFTVRRLLDYLQLYYLPFYPIIK